MTLRSESLATSPMPLAIGFLYFLPIASWIFFSYFSLSPSISWWITLIGLMILALGTALFIALFRSIEVEPVQLQEPAPPPELSQLLEKKAVLDETPLLLSEIEKLKDAFFKESQKSEQLQIELSKAREGYDTMRDALEKIERERSEKIDDAKAKIESLEIESHQKQTMIDQLENQIHDLRYEIKTLLQLTEVNHKSQHLKYYPKTSVSPLQEEFTPFPLEGTIDSNESAHQLLKRCVHIVQKISVGYRASTLRTFSANPYALDLRRLVDALRSESGALIVACDSKENKILFASKECKELLGYSSENFIQDFKEILGDSIIIWEEALQKLLTKGEFSFSLSFKSKNLETIPLQAIAGSISSGVFRSVVIAIFYKINFSELENLL